MLGMDHQPPDLPKRKPQRLHYFDYSNPGAYFITVCCVDMKTLFGSVVDSAVVLNRLGQVAHAELIALSEHHNAVADTFIVMPNHIHAILFLEPKRFAESLSQTGGTGAAPAENSRATPPLGVVVGLYKQAVTRQVRAMTGDRAYQVWQRGFHEHIVRNEEDLQTRRQYILENPQRWSEKRRC